MKSGQTPETKDYYSGLETPSSEDLQYQIQQLVEQGVLSPEDAEAVLVGDSSFNGITLDPQLKENQMSALTSIMDIGESGGMTLEDKANLSKIQNQELAAQRGQRESILQNAQERGVGGSGLELMAQLQNQQDSATRQSQKDLDIAAMAQNRALEALMQGGEMSGQMIDQSFNQQAKKADANDAIAKFNAQNQQQTNLVNTGARNSAQAANLENKQNISNQNAVNLTAQNKQKADIAQQQFENQMKKRSGQAGIAQANAQAQGQNSQNEANAWNQTIGMGAGVGSAFIKSDENSKKDIKDSDTSDLLDKITGYSYKYKDPKDGEGEHFGPMAQDLEKSDLGKSMVENTPNGKMVDSGKAAMAALGMMADMHERIKKMEAERG